MQEPTTINLHLLIACIRDYAIFTLSPEGIITSWNPGAVTIKGYTAEEAIGQHISILYRDEDAQRGIPDHNLRIAEAEGVFRDPEGIRKRKNGEIFTAEVEIVSLVENGVLLGFAKIIRDVTERIAMRDDLRQAHSDLEQFTSIAAQQARDLEAQMKTELAHEHHRLRAVLDALPLGVFIADANGRILEANGAAESIWGGAPKAERIAEYQQYRAWWSKTGKRVSDQEWAMSKALLHGETTIGDEIDIERFDGRRATILNSGAPIYDDAGAVIGGVVVEIDITERKAAEEALKQANADLEQFASLASHDLQEPLRMIRSYLTLLRRQAESKFDERERTYVAEAIDGAERMSRLIRHLLEFTRAQHGPIHLEPTSSTGALAEAIHNLQSRIDASGGVITHGRLPHVLADRSHLIRLFQNLVGNALKYQRKGVPPEVHVDAVDGDGRCEFSVRDNGIGIAADARERIFELFTRLHTRAEYPGTGLGLAICKRIVERHGGRIWVEPNPGGGSIFKFTVECAQHG